MYKYFKKCDEYSYVTSMVITKQAAKTMALYSNYNEINIASENSFRP